MKYVIVGTAGHIDHGKTSLVKAITGIDTDRLPEEKRRGITIDLGFAHYQLSNRVTVSFVDVPGHEKLVKNMIAGACSIDMVLLVVAADEGIMPQTVEHLNICQILGISKGVVALNKIDKVDSETLALVEEEVKEYMEKTVFSGAPVVPVSARTKEGLSKLIEAIEEVALTVERRKSITPFLMPVDRVFEVKGFGAVVTGTVFSGRVRVKDEVEILPQGLKCRVRNIQVRGKDVEESQAGYRTALNLQGVEVGDIERGCVVAQPDVFRSSDIIDAWIFLTEDAKPLKDLHPVRVHIYTKEVVGRVKLLEVDTLVPGQGAYARIHLDDKVVAVNNQPFVLRSYSPVVTIGGGVVLDAVADVKKIKRKELAARLRELHGADDVKRVLLFIKWSSKGVTVDYIKSKLTDPLVVDGVLSELVARGLVVKAGKFYMHQDLASEIVKQIEKEVNRIVSEKRYISLVSYRELSHILRLDEDVIRELSTLSDGLRNSPSGVSLGGIEKERDPAVEKVESIYLSAGFTPPTIDEVFDQANIPVNERRALLRLLVDRGILVRVNMEMALHRKWFDELVRRVNRHFEIKPDLTVADFKKIIEASRKYAIPYLEMLDRVGVTKRVGNIRKKR